MKARAARRPTGTEDGRGQRGHAQHVEDQSGRGSGVLRVVRRRHRRVAEPPGPHERTQRHTVEQIIEAFVRVPMLDVPVPLMVEQFPEVLQLFATFLSVVAEQVIDVPKIIFENIPTRIPLREPQLVEQLVEVPTVLFLRRAAR